MKRFLIVVVLVTQNICAQESTVESRNNEVRVDVFSLIASTKYNLSYERFLEGGFSAGVTGSYSDGGQLYEDYLEGSRNNLPKYEVTPFVRYALSKNPSNFYFAEVFVAANGGEYREIVRLEDAASGYYAIAEDTYFDIAVGGGLGYKIYIKDQIGVEFLVGFGTNLIDKAKSPDVVSRVGISVGYRF